jgi:hypothetical protein
MPAQRHQIVGIGMGCDKILEKTGKAGIHGISNRMQHHGPGKQQRNEPVLVISRIGLQGRFKEGFTPVSGKTPMRIGRFVCFMVGWKVLEEGLQ